MGRLALIIVLGFAVTMGIMTRTITTRLSEAVTKSTEYSSKTRAKNIASSAVEIYLSKLKIGSASVGQYTMLMMGGSADVTIDSAIDVNSALDPDSLKMTSIGTYFQSFKQDGKIDKPISDTIVILLAGNLTVNPVPINGALSVSAGSKINLATTSTDTISGLNHDMNGNLSASCADVHGLAYQQSGAVTGTLNAKINGVGAYTPDTAAVPDQPDYTNLIKQLLLLRDTTINSNTTTAPLTLGTLGNPQITVVEGGRTFHGPTTGVGILICLPGNGTFQTGPDFKFTGLIFVSDTIPSNTKSQLKFNGPATIIGGVVLQGVQVKMDAAAGSSSQEIDFSCEAIGMALGLGALSRNYIVYHWWE